MSTDAQTSKPSTHDSTDRPSTEGDASAAAAKKLTEFNKVVADLLRDLLTTFPELQPRVDDILTRLSEDETVVYEHCKQKLPDKFFDILYQNDKLFSLEADNEFLPGISFGHLWRENISDATRATLWKYLQLLLFTVVGGLSDGSSFGDTAKLFESVNQDEFKSKLEETVAQMHDLFSAKGAMPKDGEESDEAPNGINLDDLPNPNDLHDHVNSMMKGKLGELAREIAEETAADLNMGNASSVQDVFKNLMQNPAKLMNIVKSVGTKLDQKMKAGDMKESDLLKEANDMMQQMKNMPGMSSMQSMFAKMGMDLGSMGMGGAGGGAKVNVNAMQANIQRSMGAAKQRERMKERFLAKQALQEQMQMQMQMQPQQQLTAPPTIFSKGEVVERSLPSDKPALEATTVPKKKNKHKKKT